MNKKNEGICKMCGHHVLIRQKAHIIAEGRKSGPNLLMLCPTCRLMFDTHIKPKLFMALSQSGIKGLPLSWESSIYEQAAKASQAAEKKKAYNQAASSDGSKSRRTRAAAVRN